VIEVHVATPQVGEPVEERILAIGIVGIVDVQGQSAPSRRPGTFTA
jgi:hypothetical protein